VAKILTVPDRLSPTFTTEVCECVFQGGVLAVATESFYALAASVHSPIAVDRVVELKGRAPDKPLLVLVGERSQLNVLVTSIPDWSGPLLDHFWPGPLTCIFPAQPNLPEPLTGGTGTIGVRCPGVQRLASLLQLTGPLTGTSANRTGHPPLSTSQAVVEEFGEEIDLILDSGPSPGGLPSTILNLIGPPQLLREGPIGFEVLQIEFAKHGITLNGKASE
jgi:L-threonylcarbamoyladenylate synthase